MAALAVVVALAAVTVALAVVAAEAVDVADKKKTMVILKVILRMQIFENS